MKLKTIFNGCLLIPFTLFGSCIGTKSQTEETVNYNRALMNNEINGLQQRQVITPSEAAQITERLNADLDRWLQNQDMDLDELDTMFLETMKSFEAIDINQQLFSTIQGAYHIITGQISVRNAPKITQEDLEIQTALDKIMRGWFEDYQRKEDKK